MSLLPFGGCADDLAFVDLHEKLVSGMVEVIYALGLLDVANRIYSF